MQPLVNSFAHKIGEEHQANCARKHQCNRFILVFDNARNQHGQANGKDKSSNELIANPMDKVLYSYKRKNGT